jgi:hypothetical protein
LDDLDALPVEIATAVETDHVESQAVDEPVKCRPASTQHSATVARF